ncbi:R3H-associated N-terminal domain-containing protein [Parachaetomium inaequale]|uniref:R3H-associated N-terminal domain-containing protein n=1 Tax=Parachaetomium inaequale TaxID=2588326 RepID=A0AAN6SNC0_9PEZI|nr:R3H-associated N-terminal domain-containing protein [Parachaetomium inaequale]
MAITRTPPVHDEDGGGGDQQHLNPSHPPPQAPMHQHSLSNASTATVDIEAWTVAALESLRIAPIARGTGNALSIPLDAHESLSGGRDGDGAAAAAELKLRGVVFAGGDTDAYGATITPPRRPPSRRDSMRKRDALLKGKEGSRQRRRWENDRLLHVPNVVPPLPSDWQICPTHRVLPPVPYQLAQYWDKGLRERVEAQQQQQQQQHRHRHHHHKHNPSHLRGSGSDVPGVGHVPRDLRNTAKRTPAVKAWLRVLEEPVREFVIERGLAVVAAATPAPERERDGGEGSSSDETDPDDDEIVFVGRSGRTMRDGKPLPPSWKKAHRHVAGQQGEERGMVLEMEEEAGGGAFKRWLTHSISDYYGLASKSAMVGNPARRVVYVGVKQTQQKHVAPRHKPSSRPVLPPPLWEMF